MKRLWILMKSGTLCSFTIRHWLVISSLFSLTLLSVRIITSGRLSYAFLGWNLFLAYIPFLIANWLARQRQLFNQKIKLMGVLFIWILFMPNSFYILTDLFHLDNLSEGHPWFDLTLILSFAWTGILLGVLSIRKMEMLLAEVKGKLVATIVICAIMWLNAFGIYVGRYLRFNSWDVLVNPLALFSEIGEILLNPYAYRYVWAMSFCFASFMIILYYSSKKLTD